MQSGEGTTLEHIATIVVPLDGQAWAWDRSARRIIFGLTNGAGEVVSMTIPPVPLPLPVPVPVPVPVPSTPQVAQ